MHANERRAESKTQTNRMLSIAVEWKWIASAYTHTQTARVPFKERTNDRNNANSSRMRAGNTSTISFHCFGYRHCFHIEYIIYRLMHNRSTHTTNAFNSYFINKFTNYCTHSRNYVVYNGERSAVQEILSQNIASICVQCILHSG